MSMENGHFITGTTLDNQKFRPSDWAERTASVCGCFDSQCRLHYNPMLRPAQYNGMRGLYVATELVRLNPDAYRYAMEFALSNKLQILEIGNTEAIREVA